MKLLKNTARTMALALPMLLTFDVAQASAVGDVPATRDFRIDCTRRNRRSGDLPFAQITTLVGHTPTRWGKGCPISYRP